MARGSTTAWVLVALSVVAVLVGFATMREEPVPASAQPPGEVAGQGYSYLSNRSALLFRVGNRADLPDEAGLVPYEGNEAVNRHVVHVSRQAAEHAAATKGRLTIQLPDGEQFVVQFERAERAPNGDWTFIGKVATRLGPQSAVLTFGSAGLFGVLPTPQGRQMQISTTRGVTVLEPVRPMHPRDPQTGELPVDYVVPKQGAGTQASKVATDQPGQHASRAAAVPAPKKPPPSSSASAPQPSANTVATEVQIDLLGLYTKNMVELRGSAAAAETECNNYLAFANQAHRDSNTGVRLNFVGLRQIDYPAEIKIPQVLIDLQANRLPDGTDVYQLRDTLRADLVAVFRPFVSGDIGGQAYLAGAGGAGVDGAHEAFGYSVNGLDPYVFAHEIGHNLGSTHDAETLFLSGDSVGGAYDYSMGFRQDGSPSFATIMAYQARGDQPRVGYFSHPGTVSCLGTSCGTAGTDNARSIRNMALPIAEYRLPPGMIFVNNRVVIEGDPENWWTQTMQFVVMLSSPAPAGGVRFDIATRSGTALAGIDFSAPAPASVVIPEGQSTYRYAVTILPDTAVEGTETFFVTLSAVVGASVYRGEATGTIIDDDPRAIVSGRLIAPAGIAMPDRDIQVMTHESGTSGQFSGSYWARPPNFEFRLPVMKGSRLSVDVSNAPVDGDRSTFDLGVISADTSIDLRLKPSWLLSGSLRFPDGAARPTQPIQLWIWGAKGDTWGIGATADPPNFNYSMRVVDRAAVRIEVADPPAPFVRQNVWLGEVTSDVVRDIPMGQLPSVVVIGQRVKEGGPGTRQLQLSVLLSAPAPAGGASVDIETRPGTALAGTDFTSRARETLMFSGGQTSMNFAVTIHGDDVVESDEYFQVVLSNPVGTWLPSPESSVWLENDDTGIPRSDVNGDGRSDLFWHNESEQQFAWWLMDGAASTGGSGLGVAAGLRMVGAGDLNGDGLRDVVWRDASRRELWLLQGGANGQFQMHSLGQHPDGDYSLVGVGDVDGDGKDDLLWHSRTRGTLAWWLMDGSSRRPGGSSQISSRYEVAGVGDLNGDGRVDVVWRDSGRTEVWLWAAQSGGGFSARFISAHPPAAWELIGVEDLDGDSRADLVWHDAVNGRLDWWLMDGETRRGVMSQAVPPRYEVLAFADLNGDGRQDLVWSDRARTELWAWLATAQGIFTPEYIAGHPVGGWQLTSPGTDYPHRSVSQRAATDINGDGRSDLTWRNANAQRTAWWLMNGPAFTVPTEQAAGAQFSIVARNDFDGDGRQDMLWTDSARSQLWMWIARGTGFEVHALGAHPPAGWTVVASADVDGDGRSDLLWHNPDLQQLDWWYMDGALRVGMGSQFIPRQYRLVIAGDFDGDRRFDLVWRDLASTELWRWAGDGYSFSASWISAYPPGWSVVAAGDLDGDSRDDLVWHHSAGGQVDWWLMHGTRRTGAGSQAIPSKYALADYGDMDGDGRLDLIWVDDRRTEIWMWHEAGANPSMRASFVGAHPSGGWELVKAH